LETIITSIVNDNDVFNISWKYLVTLYKKKILIRINSMYIFHAIVASQGENILYHCLCLWIYYYQDIWALHRGYEGKVGSMDQAIKSYYFFSQTIKEITLVNRRTFHLGTPRSVPERVEKYILIRLQTLHYIPIGGEIGSWIREEVIITLPGRGCTFERKSNPRQTLFSATAQFHWIVSQPGSYKTYAADTFTS
jgi:hypothetical protein